MGEIKSVKVDNWGVFFLQKLQNFFNKTDYCDLTLQFRDNSQLKVHRLVLSACTDYFNVLEQSCEFADDALIMPNELQADVVVPIVNFMYTGTLEFELKMYGKLLRTAKEMNMTVLLKLLEAHRRTMENVNRAQRPPSPKAIRRRLPAPGQVASMPIYQTQGTQGRRILASNVGVSGNGNTIQRRIIQTKTAGTNVSPVQIYRQQIGSTSVVRTSTLRGSNSSQPQALQAYIKNEPMEYETYDSTCQQQSSSSPFEQLRKGYNNNKRPSTFMSPPAKKPNLEDVKEFAEQQRMRKQIAAEYGDDPEFEGMMDDDIRNDDDDEDALMSNAVQSSTLNSGNIHTTTASTQASASSVASATITIKPESDSQPPTIIVKDHSGSKMDHAKIISEVLRQYPQLAKGNKNIKLKIMPSGQGQAQRIVIKKEGTAAEHQQTPESQNQHALNEAATKQNQPQLRATSQIITKAAERPPQHQTQIAIGKQTVATVQQTANAVVSSDNSQQKRRIDSKTMHALIALGAENMSGPWLCLRCGLNGRPISIPSYRGFRRHLINTHKETIDPALCEHCGWRSQNVRELHFHVQIEHKIKTTLYTFPECLLCAELFLDTNALNQHMLDSHPSANKQQCIYCNKIFIKDMQLYTHLKLYHKHQAIEDGIIDVSEEGENPELEEHLESEQQEDIENKDKKVKILSDISLPMASSIIKLEGNTLTAESNVIDAQTKFVTADGNEMLLTDEQRKEIMSQLNQEHNNGGVVMVLNDAIFSGAESAALEVTNATPAVVAAQEPAIATADNASGEDFDDNQIYAELATEKADKEKQQDDTKDADESLKWAENLVSEHDIAENENESDSTLQQEEEKAKKEFISKKLKELTVDWSEDENEEDDEQLDKSRQTEESEANNECQDLKDKVDDKTEEEKIDAREKEPEISDSQDKPIQEEGNELAIETQDDDKEPKEEKQEQCEQTDLDMAMQALHEGEQTEVEESNTTSMFIATKEAEFEEDEKNAEEDKKVEITKDNPEQPLSTALLEELMSATPEESADSSGLPTALKDVSINPAVERNTDDELDAFAKAGLTDVEEFSTIESSGSAGEDKANLSSSDLGSTTVNMESVTKNEVEKVEKVEKVEENEEEKLGGTTSTTLAKANTSSSEWEDIDEEDNVKGH